MQRAKQILKWMLGAFFVIAGANHFIQADFYASIVPPYLPWPVAIVYASGFCEVVLGIMLFIRRAEVIAAWGMIALMLAVFPANIQMAVHPELYSQFSPLALWARLPLQGILIAWAFWYTRPRRLQIRNA